jgi:uncharacterized protein
VEEAKIGAIVWTDLTVPNAELVRDFYQKVIGWTASPVDMGGYSDFNMCLPGTDRPVVGICHAREGNAKLPPQWMLYVNVADISRSIKACEESGGKIVARLGEKYCVIQDPAGAVMMICET